MTESWRRRASSAVGPKLEKGRGRIGRVCFSGLAHAGAWGGEGEESGRYVWIVGDDAPDLWRERGEGWRRAGRVERKRGKEQERREKEGEKEGENNRRARA
eukprot:scaffold198855_cov29-Tisochrysis_lutea.AAC.4